MHHDNEALAAALARLQSRRTFGIKLGLEATRQLLERLGNPQDRLTIIHVAGTNGKGSVSALLASVLTAAGYRTGLYSSPHMTDFRERMRIDGRMISKAELADQLDRAMPLIEELGCTFFEGATAVALGWFADRNVDVVVLETGMGGRLDATNVVAPVVAVVTSIGLDHQRHLGESYEKIAAEKGGIIKSGAPAVVGDIRPRLRSIFRSRAEEVGTTVRFAEDDVRIVAEGIDRHAMTLSIITSQRELPSVTVDLVGVHQITNVRTCLATLEVLPPALAVDDAAILEGFGSVRRRTGFSGRFEALASEPRLILDAAHNPDGAAALAATLDRVLAPDEQVYALFGAVGEKSIDQTLALLAPRITRLYAVAADAARSLPSDEIAHEAEKAGIAVVDVGSVGDGLVRAIEQIGADDTLLVFGSLFVLGEAITALRKSGRMPSEPEDDDRIVADRQRYVLPDQDQTTVDEVVNDSITTDGETREQRHSAEKTGSRRTIKSWPAAERPRERLRALGPEALSDAELLAILLRTGTTSQTAVDVARDLLGTFGDRSGDGRLVDITGRSLAELEEVDGIGPVKAVTLAAAFALGNRVVARNFGERPLVTSPADVARLFIPRMRALRKEQFHVVLLNTAGRVMRTEMVSEGGLDSAIVDPRGVFRSAIVESAAAIVGLHNHPSGNPEPSREDVAVTRQLVESGNVLGIPFRDHLVIAGEEYVSLADRGYV